jgi:hypothetical protein
MTINGLDYCNIERALKAEIMREVSEMVSAPERLRSYGRSNIDCLIETLNKVQDSFLQCHYELQGVELVSIPNPLAVAVRRSEVA